ncbi:MAG: site-2 protease family protein [Planctomycetes bacterium]|nr:site-2 protease family protein [Planctomycetota bacterium]
MGGSIRLFRIFGITVFLHWTWFLVAIYQISYRQGTYTSLWWCAFEYLSLFCLVLLHEFGHSLATRQVGGKADRILLWPLGGIAYVRLPARPGATLWGIFAGPLVNLIFAGIFFVFGMVLLPPERPAVQSDAYTFFFWIVRINIALLIFNLLPIYPLDGGQIFRALLWFLLGPIISLIIAALVGILGAIAMVLLAIWWQVPLVWIVVIAVFILLNCWAGLWQALSALRLYKAPRRIYFACPVCKANPPVGLFWRCDRCGNKFDTFETQAICPNCIAIHPTTACPLCGSRHPIHEWAAETFLQNQKAMEEPSEDDNAGSSVI